MGVCSGRDKVVSLREAAQVIRDGDTIAVGGALSARQPLALIREMIRQGRKDLASVGGAHGVDVDLLVAAGLLKSVQHSYVGFENDFGLAPNYRRVCQEGGVEILETDCNVILQRLRAASFGVPFLPMPRIAGIDLLEGNPAFRVVACPFTGETLTAVRALRPDVALIHGLKGDRAGNVHLPHPHFMDGLLATAAARTVVTVEEIVAEEEVRRLGVSIPHYLVTALAERPFGAHPTSCYPAYAYDRRHLAEYVRLAKAGKETFQRDYLDAYVNSVTEEDYLRRVGDGEHFARLTGWKDGVAAWQEVFAE